MTSLNPKEKERCSSFYEQGKLSAAEARRFIKQERESFLEREFKNSAVTYTDAVRIHNLATPEEISLLDRLLRAKRATDSSDTGRARSNGRKPRRPGKPKAID
jgi:hypothetical protein